MKLLPMRLPSTTMNTPDTAEPTHILVSRLTGLPLQTGDRVVDGQGDTFLLHGWAFVEAAPPGEVHLSFEGGILRVRPETIHAHFVPAFPRLVARTGCIGSHIEDRETGRTCAFLTWDTSSGLAHAMAGAGEAIDLLRRLLTDHAPGCLGTHKPENCAWCAASKFLVWTDHHTAPRQ